MDEVEEYKYGPKPKRTKSPKQALNALMGLCSRGERSTGDALRLMRSWGVDGAEAERVLAQLVEERYIDNRRYAEAFVRDKISFSGWGAYKIRMALARKGVDKSIIEDMLSNLDRDEMKERLEQLLLKKRRSSRESDQYKLKSKLIRSGVSAGYDMGSVIEIVNRIIDIEDEF